MEANVTLGKDVKAVQGAVEDQLQTLKSSLSAESFADQILVSNQSVIASNTLILEVLTTFNDHVKDVLKAISEHTQSSAYPFEQSSKIIVPEIKKINKKAVYVVAKGRKFMSSATGYLIEEGAELKGLETERLQSLISQGIAIEKAEEK